MDQDLQEHEEESTRDLRLSRWRVPTLAAVLIVNLCLVALAVGRPVAPSEQRVPVTAAPLPDVVVAIPREAATVAISPKPPLVVIEPAPVDTVPVEPAPVERVVIAPDVDLVMPSEPAPSEPAPVEQPQPPAPLPTESEPTEPTPAQPMPMEPVPAETTPAEPAPQEPVPAEPVPAEPKPVGPVVEPPMLPRNELPALFIVNPPQSGGPIHLAIDGIVISLLPGEYHRVAGADRRRVEYHRGDDFDYAQHELAEGVHQFSVSDSGWTLVVVEREKAGRLLESCRAIKP